MSTAVSSLSFLPTRRSVLNLLTHVLRPLLRISLRHGVTVQDLEETVRWLAVDITMSEKEFGLAAQRQTKSRVSVLTGLSRKEVHRLSDRPAPHEDADFTYTHRLGDIIAGWTQDPDFSAAPDKPKKLTLKSKDRGFQQLVRRYGADVPYRAVLDELERCGLVELDEENRVKLLKTSYKPSSGSTEELTVVRVCSGDLLNTIEHNFRAEQESDRLYQRQVYCYIPQSKVPTARQFIRSRAERLEREVDQYLYELEREGHANIEPRHRTGIGLYAYED